MKKVGEYGKYSLTVEIFMYVFFFLSYNSSF